MKGITEEKEESWAKAEEKVLEVFSNQLALPGVGVIQAH